MGRFVEGHTRDEAEWAAQARVGRRIALLRRQRGLTQHDLARSLGASRTSVVLLEGGQRQLKLRLLAPLCAALDCSLDDLLWGLDGPSADRRSPTQ